MNVLGFVQRYNGASLRSLGGVGAECVDVANQYLFDCFGLPHEWLNAKDWEGISIPGFDWVRNTPLNSPIIGSIVVWGGSVPAVTGVNGHIALAIASDVMRLITFDQNWPQGSNCHLEVHGYRGIVGWHQPR